MKSDGFGTRRKKWLGVKVQEMKEGTRQSSYKEKTKYRGKAVHRKEVLTSRRMELIPGKVG